MTRTRFDPRDTESTRLLKGLGFSDSDLRDGTLTPEEISAKGLSVELFQALARLDSSYAREEFRPKRSPRAADHFLSKNEAMKGALLLQRLGIHGLRAFSTPSSCWSRNLVQFFRHQVLGDKRYVLDDHARPVSDSATGVVSVCPYDPSRPELMENIFFPPELAPAPIREAAASIVAVEACRERTGSAVQVEGGFLTVFHLLTPEVRVLRCPKGTQDCDEPIASGLSIRGGIRRLDLRDDAVIRVQRERDWVAIRLPNLARPVVIARQPVKEGDTVFAISLPSLDGGREAAVLVSKGTVVGFADILIESTAQIRKGSSGGALVNERGELVGIAVARRPRDVLSREFGPRRRQRWSFTGSLAEPIAQHREAIARALGQKR